MTTTNVDGSNPGPNVVTAPIVIAGGGPQFNVANVATDIIAMYGVTGAVQAAAITAVSTSAGVTGAVGFTSTQAAALLTAVNSIITALHNIGLTA